MHQFIDEIDDQPYMRGDFVLNKLIQACKYLYREEFERMISEQRIATKDTSDVFTPERLLGVETDKGFIIGILVSNAFDDYIKPSYYVYTSESPYKLEYIHKVKFYISDDSDETVSFEEYVNKFYDGGVCGNK